MYAKQPESFEQNLKAIETEEERRELSRQIARNAAWREYSRSMKEKYEWAASHL
jgi:hypothetical protein